MHFSNLPQKDAAKSIASIIACVYTTINVIVAQNGFCALCCSHPAKCKHNTVRRGITLYFSIAFRHVLCIVPFGCCRYFLDGSRHSAFARRDSKVKCLWRCRLLQLWHSTLYITSEYNWCHTHSFLPLWWFNLIMFISCEILHFAESGESGLNATTIYYERCNLLC